MKTINYLRRIGFYEAQGLRDAYRCCPVPLTCLGPDTRVKKMSLAVTIRRQAGPKPTAPAGFGLQEIAKFVCSSSCTQNRISKPHWESFRWGGMLAGSQETRRISIRGEPHRARSRLWVCAVVRRRFSSGSKSHPAIAPAGSNRSSHGGDEMAEAFGMACHELVSLDFRCGSPADQQQARLPRSLSPT